MILSYPADPMEGRPSIRDALVRAEKELSRARVPDARTEAEHLLCHVLGFKRHELFLNSQRPLSPGESKRFEGFIERRKRREPSAYITGTAEFFGYALKVTRATLIPRPETELLVEAAIRLFPEEGVVIDLCTGSGCIAVTLAKELSGRGIRIYATDISAEALDVAGENAKTHGVDGLINFFHGDLFAPLEGLGLRAKCSLILSNPPYVSDSEVEGLEPEIKEFEPLEALSAGSDGLSFIRRIIDESPGWLVSGGRLLMEMGYGQAAKARDMVEGNRDYDDVEIKRDLSGIERLLVVRRR